MTGEHQSPSRRADRSRRAAIAASLANLWFLPVLQILLLGWVAPGANRFVLDRTAGVESTILAQLVPAMLLDSVPDANALIDRLAHVRRIQPHQP